MPSVVVIITTTNLSTLHFPPFPPYTATTTTKAYHFLDTVTTERDNICKIPLLEINDYNIKKDALIKQKSLLLASLATVDEQLVVLENRVENAKSILKKAKNVYEEKTGK